MRTKFLYLSLKEIRSKLADVSQIGGLMAFCVIVGFILNWNKIVAAQNEYNLRINGLRNAIHKKI